MSPRFERERVTVLSIDTSLVGQPHQDPRGIAITMNDFRYQRKIGVSTRHGSGVYPKEGETWIVDRSMGTWTFVMRLEPKKPLVTDFVSLLVVLADLGFIEYALSFPIDNTAVEANSSMTVAVTVNSTTSGSSSAQSDANI